MIGKRLNHVDNFYREQASHRSDCKIVFVPNVSMKYNMAATIQDLHNGGLLVWKNIKIQIGNTDDSWIWV